MSKIRIGVLFGGQSVEHEVSIRSAKNVIEAIDKEKYEVVAVEIDKQGRWQGEPLVKKLAQSIDQFDVIFPVLHGGNGEDGSIQGLLKLLDIPFVGAGILGSAVGLDKDIMNRLLQAAGLPVAQFLVFRSGDRVNFDNIKGRLGLPFFVKPANTGSSVGISKVKSRDDFAFAIQLAFRYDHKIILEEFISGREIECSILGNDNPKASLPGEIIIKAEFYSYEVKYLNQAATQLKIPADLPPELIQRIQALAIQTFKVLECAGLARVDFFLREDGRIFVNEINTIPGFTQISMYPKLWEASGISYLELIDQLIQLALERYQQKKALKTDYAISDPGDMV